MRNMQNYNFAYLYILFNKYFENPLFLIIFTKNSDWCCYKILIIQT